MKIEIALRTPASIHTKHAKEREIEINAHIYLCIINLTKPSSPTKVSKDVPKARSSFFCHVQRFGNAEASVLDVKGWLIAALGSHPNLPLRDEM